MTMLLFYCSTVLLNGDPFRDFSASLDDYMIDSSNPQWFNYVLCGLKGITEYKNLKSPKGKANTLEKYVQHFDT